MTNGDSGGSGPWNWPPGKAQQEFERQMAAKAGSPFRGLGSMEIPPRPSDAARIAELTRENERLRARLGVVTKWIADKERLCESKFAGPSDMYGLFSATELRERLAVLARAEEIADCAPWFEVGQ